MGSFGFLAADGQTGQGGGEGRDGRGAAEGGEEQSRHHTSPLEPKSVASHRSEKLACLFEVLLNNLLPRRLHSVRFPPVGA